MQIHFLLFFLTLWVIEREFYLKICDFKTGEIPLKAPNLMLSAKKWQVANTKQSFQGTFTEEKPDKWPSEPDSEISDHFCMIRSDLPVTNSGHDCLSFSLHWPLETQPFVFMPLQSVLNCCSKKFCDTNLHIYSPIITACQLEEALSPLRPFSFHLKLKTHHFYLTLHVGITQ